MALTPWASIARIEVDGRHSGTGFLVSRNLVVTAMHVVAEKATGRPFGQIRLYFNTDAEFRDGSVIFETNAAIKKDPQSIEHDFAVLECAQVPAKARPLRLSDRARPLDSCSCPGFAAEAPSGFTAIGDISSLNDPLPGGGTAVGVQLKLGSGVRMKGHSGAPLFVRDRVVGLLRPAFLDDNERTSGGIVHATAIQHIVESCNRLNPDLLACRVSVKWPRLANPISPLLLADRKAEFELFREMISGQSRKRILLLQGESGSGKSTLMRELVAFGDSFGLPALVADFKGSRPLRTILDALELVHETILPATRVSGGSQQFSMMLDELADMERPIILMLDNWQDSGEDVRRWIGNKVLPAVPTIPPLILLIGGQNVQDVRNQSKAEFTHFSELQPITSTDDWHDYSRRKWPDTALTRDHVSAVAVVGRGLPHVVDNNLDLVRNSLLQQVSLGGAS